MNSNLARAALLIAAALLTAPVASAEGGLPTPEPGIVGAEPAPSAQGGETSYDAATGETRISAPGVSGGEISTTPAYVNPMQAGPNINGTPCEGSFESTVCYAEQMGDSPVQVQPRSSISSSP
jgi:hypothetical protein